MVGGRPVAPAAEENAEAFGENPFHEVERVVLASAALRVLPLPAKLQAVIDEMIECVGQLTETRSQELKDKWRDLYKHFYATVRSSVADANEVMRALGAPAASSS
jgi:hypothetical protein